ncbi:Type II toxin-antitoxin system RelE/ParE family toxin [Vibrio crassostreae]|nr:Type II toxin-antitoxin system RelE/ParE family toxin [Vibrio crassostreae]CAK2802296.1 Type II toxin-antitoxin system RelE/ParE family toxin [Vibrio crassostreae]CAK3418446.1 Type II toxin-antitoxin system RelE/ParE family toxin [Vibrio crassostreae]
MMHYKLSSAVQSDLIEIRRYTLERRGQNYFRFPLKHHVIYYIQKQEHIVIAAVLSKHISPAKHFSQIS